jgi:thiol-disulfide isomerase/thioredoxin
MEQINKLILLLVFAFSIATANSQGIKKWKLHDLEAAIKNSNKPTIINFFATFCKPCLEELPYFQEMVKRYDKAGVQLILVSLDMLQAYPKKIGAFAAKNKIVAPIFFLDETDADLFCPKVDQSWSGAIPASLFVNNKIGYRKFFEDQLSKEQVEKEIISMTQSREK